MNLRIWGHILSGQPMTCNAHFVVTPAFKISKTSFSEILKHMSNIKQEYSHTLKFLTELGPNLILANLTCKLQK